MNRADAKIIFLILGLTALGILCVVLPIIFNIRIEVFAYSLFGYTFISIFLSILAERTKIKCLQNIVGILYIPLSIIFLILKLSLPTIVLLFNMLVLFSTACGIPLIVLHQVDSFLNLGLKDSTIVFLSISSASLISVYLSKYLLNLLLKYSPITMNGLVDRPQNKFMKELTITMYQKENIIFVIYAFYFIYLVMWSFYKIQYDKSLLHGDMDSAILQSFLVFIAFTNMIIKSKEVMLAPRDVLYLYAKIILSKNTYSKLDEITNPSNKDDESTKD